MPTVVLILLIVIGLPMGIGLIAILTEHQRKMAEIVHRSGANKDSLEQMAGEITRLRSELADMRDLVNQQVLAHDNRPVLEEPSTLQVPGGR